MKQFSVVTPTRNALSKLRCCVGSVRGQKGVTVEHLVQDACSIDGTSDWLAEQNDLKWVSESDGGMYDAINRGWDRAHGEIFSWLNSDEQYLPGTLEVVQSAFEADQSLDMVFGNVIVVRPTGDVIAAKRDVGLRSFYIANSYLHASSCSMFFHRRLWDSGRLRLDSSYTYAADLDLILRLLSEGVNVRKVQSYLSAFGFDGTNLSCSPEMLFEEEGIKAKHGASPLKFIRTGAVLCRNIERFFSGTYRPDDIAFEFCVNENPDYVSINAEDVPFYYATRT